MHFNNKNNNTLCFITRCATIQMGSHKRFSAISRNIRKKSKNLQLRYITRSTVRPAKTMTDRIRINVLSSPVSFNDSKTISH